MLTTQRTQETIKLGLTELKKEQSKMSVHEKQLPKLNAVSELNNSLPTRVEKGGVCKSR